MEESNSFVVALDNRRHWYRYHHLFRDLLRHELLVTDPERAVEAHRRAAHGCAVQGETSEAILHTIAAGDLAEAVEMVAAAWRPLSYMGSHQTIRTWLAGPATRRPSRRCATVRRQRCHRDRVGAAR